MQPTEIQSAANTLLEMKSAGLLPESNFRLRDIEGVAAMEMGRDLPTWQLGRTMSALGVKQSSTGRFSSEDLRTGLQRYASRQPA